MRCSNWDGSRNPKIRFSIFSMDVLKKPEKGTIGASTKRHKSCFAFFIPLLIVSINVFPVVLFLSNSLNLVPDVGCILDLNGMKQGQLSLHSLLPYAATAKGPSVPTFSELDALLDKSSTSQ